MSGSGDGDDAVPESPEVHFSPVVSLPEVEVKTMEEGEEEVFRIRAKLYRYASECEPAEWKERGTGDIRLLKNVGKETVRILMRRDKTHKVCANHYVTEEMKLKPNCGSDRALVWNTLADFADAEPKPETLAIRFANPANTQKFKVAFEDAQEFVRNAEASDDDDDDDSDEAVKKLAELSVKDDVKKEDVKKEDVKKEDEATAKADGGSKKDDGAAKEDDKDKKEKPALSAETCL